MWESFKAHLVADARYWYKLASVQLAALAGILSALIIANQGLLFSLMAYLPGGFWRTLIAVLIGFVVFVVPTITRLWSQNHGG